MSLRKTAPEALLRLLLVGAALAVLWTAAHARQDWQEEISMSFDYTWDGWLAWIGLLVVAGILVGLACLPGLPKTYRWHVPFVISVAPMALLAHFVLVVENAGPGEELPWVLGRYTVYMDLTSQFALAVIAGFGIAAGLQPRRRAAPEGAEEGREGHQAAL
ncbi:MAG: hypothetical protein M3273_01240 [Actinomycetota bacterium]|nr:hypothetical protein [Actinomycetota bacterium]